MAFTFVDTAAPVRSPRRRRLSAVAKRAIDVMGSVGLLVVTAPVMAFLALAILVTDGHPVLFRQERIGRDGQRFMMLKFRTMREGADDAAQREHNRRELAGEETDGHKDAADDRITGVGRWIRASSLDELPQLFNVLVGDMSLVGPRPALPWEVELFDPQHRRRETVRPGITGLWQVSGRNNLTMLEMLELDVRYVERRSTSTDLGIMARTPLVVLRREGAG